MPTNPEFHDKLGEVVGLSQTVRLIVRELAARIEPDLELAHLLQRVALDVEQMQRRCDSFVATNDDISQSRVTARAREIKANAAADMQRQAATVELLSLLVLAAKESLIRWRVLAALIPLQNDPSVVDLAASAILLHESHVQALRRHLP